MELFARRAWCAFVAAFAIAAVALFPQVAVADAADTPSDAVISQSEASVELLATAEETEARKVLDLLNAVRKEAGVAPVGWNTQLEATAKVRAKELEPLYLRLQYASDEEWEKFDPHIRPDGSSIATAFSSGWTRIGENVAFGATTGTPSGWIMSAVGANDGWTNSPHHYENMINPEFKSVGVAVYRGILRQGSDTFIADYWVEVFSDQKPTGIPAETVAGFSDVRTTDWFAPYVVWANDERLMTGYADGTFRPNNKLARADAVTVLWRYLCPDESAAYTSAVQKATKNTTGLRNVKDGTYYTAAANWAVENGVIKGSNGDFKPTASLTREDFALILARTAGVDLDEPQDDTIYRTLKNTGQTSGYAVNALQWATSTGLITGKGGTDLAPKAPVTRAEMATIMERAVVEYGIITK